MDFVIADEIASLVPLSWQWELPIKVPWRTDGWMDGCMDTIGQSVDGPAWASLNCLITKADFGIDIVIVWFN